MWLEDSSTFASGWAIDIGFAALILQHENSLPGLVNQQFATWKIAIEIVGLPIENGDFP